MSIIDNNIVRAAMNKLFELAGVEGTGIEADYPKNMLAQRVVGPLAKGSIYEMHTVETLKEAFMAANWEAAENPAVFPGCQGYITYDIPGGLYGVMDLNKLPDDAKLIIKDNKSTGFASLCVEGGTRIPAKETWAIVGPADNGEKVVYTFYPGAPTPKATTPTEELPVGTQLTKAEAIAMGFNTANVIGLLGWIESWEETNPNADPDKARNGGGYSQPHIVYRFNDGYKVVVDDGNLGNFGLDLSVVLYDENDKEVAYFRQVKEINGAGDRVRDKMWSSWTYETEKYAYITGYAVYNKYEAEAYMDLNEWEEKYDKWDEFDWE